jgi:hypothetical protein
MFEIKFISEPAIQDEELSATGIITIGDFSETFISPIGYWTLKDYERHWSAAAQRLLRGLKRSAFLTSMYEPTQTNFLTWYPVWQVGNGLCFQNQILFFPKRTTHFDPGNPFKHVGKRRITSAGRPISEWKSSLDDIQQFIES